MLRPTVTGATETIYGQLPEFYRAADEAQNWTLLRYVSLLGDRADPVVQAIVDFDFRGPSDEGGSAANSSALVDPVLADVSWLPWLAQLYGVRLSGPVGQLRQAIVDATRGITPGSKGAIVNAARYMLTGERRVDIIPQTRPGGMAGGPWDVLIRTRHDETPADDGARIIAAIIAADAKPAGVVLWHGFWSASWDTLEAAYPTSDDWDARTWDELEATEQGPAVVDPGDHGGSPYGTGDGGFGGGFGGYGGGAPASPGGGGTTENPFGTDVDGGFGTSTGGFQTP